MPKLNLLDLPAEILSEIFYHSREPALIHTCRRTWKALPSFVWYSQRLTALALCTCIHRRYVPNCDIELYERFKLPGVDAAFSESERIELQARLFSSPWFGKRHLIKTTKTIMFSIIREIRRIYGIDANVQTLRVLRRLLNEAFANESLVLSTTFFMEHEAAADQCIRIMVVNPLEFRADGPFARGPYPFDSTWYGEGKSYYALALNIPVLPVAVIEAVANHDKRSHGLLQALYTVKTKAHSYNNFCPLTPETMKTIETCIERLLRSTIHPLDQDDEDLRLLLMLDTFKHSNPLERNSDSCDQLPPVCNHVGQTKLEENSVCVRQRYYEQVIDERNIDGFKRLLKINPALCFPPKFFFMSRFDDGEHARDAALRKQAALYIKALRSSEAARKALLKKSRPETYDGQSSQGGGGDGRPASLKVQRSIKDYITRPVRALSTMLMKSVV